MIRIVASFSKKVPAEQEYSSKSFLASLEMEVADEIASDTEKLQGKLRWLWNELKRSVEGQIKESSCTTNNNSGRSDNHRRNDNPGNNGGSERSNGNGGYEKASNKQIKFLIGLAREQGKDFKALCLFTRDRVGKDSVYGLTKSEASCLIEEMKN